MLLATRPIDFRKGAHALAVLAQEVLAEDPFSGAVIVCECRPNNGSPANSVLSLRYVACSTRARSRRKPARPYIVRFNILSRFI